MQKCRRTLEEGLRRRARQSENLAHAVAIIVMLDIFATIHRGEANLTRWALLVEVVRIYHLLAAVHLEHGRDEGDDVVPDLLDVRRLFHGEPIAELHEHLRSAQLR